MQVVLQALSQGLGRPGVITAKGGKRPLGWDVMLGSRLQMLVQRKLREEEGRWQVSALIVETSELLARTVSP